MHELIVLSGNITLSHLFIQGTLGSNGWATVHALHSHQDELCDHFLPTMLSESEPEIRQSWNE